jgi:hypothetical protein
LHFGRRRRLSSVIVCVGDHMPSFMAEEAD